VNLCGGVKPSKRGIAKSSNNKNGLKIQLVGLDNASLADGSITFQTSCQSTCRIIIEILDLLIKKRISVQQLKYLSKIDQNQGILYYQLINKLSMEQKLPRSTVRWNLNKLRDAGMIVAGNKNVKGVPVRLTEKGKIALRITERGQGILGNKNCPKSLFEGNSILERAHT
jgi:DNA-binding transcriptional ArsR family regulator